MVTAPSLTKVSVALKLHSSWYIDEKSYKEIVVGATNRFSAPGRVTSDENGTAIVTITTGDDKRHVTIEFDVEGDCRSDLDKILKNELLYARNDIKVTSVIIVAN